MDHTARVAIGKGWLFSIIAIVVALALTDVILLKGEVVASETVSLRSEEPGELEITRAGEQHLVQISTRRRVRGESRGSAVQIRLDAPDGTTLYETSEIVARKTRFFEFVPAEPGTYRLYVDANGALLGSGRGNARATVTVNDRRVFSRLLSF